MFVTTVLVKVKKEHIEDFIEATKKNHEESIKEPGNLRFDILQKIEDPTEFLMYEAYESEEDAKAHKETEHYRVWRDTVAPYMAKPREGIKYRSICP